MNYQRIMLLHIIYHIDVGHQFTRPYRGCPTQNTLNYGYHGPLPLPLGLTTCRLCTKTGALYDLPALATVERGQGNEGNTRSGWMRGFFRCKVTDRQRRQHHQGRKSEASQQEDHSAAPSLLATSTTSILFILFSTKRRRHRSQRHAQHAHCAKDG